MIRLRAGKRHGAGSTPASYSDTMSDRSPIETRERRVRRGIVAIDATAEHGNRVPADGKRTAVRFAVDPARQSAHHHDTGRRKLAPEHAGDLSPVRRAGAGADDRHRGLREQCHFSVTSHVEPSRWIVDRAQQWRQFAPVQDSHGVARSEGAR